MDQVSTLFDVMGQGTRIEYLGLSHLEFNSSSLPPDHFATVVSNLKGCSLERMQLHEDYVIKLLLKLKENCSLD